MSFCLAAARRYNGTNEPQGTAHRAKVTSVCVCVWLKLHAAYHNAGQRQTILTHATFHREYLEAAAAANCSAMIYRIDRL